MNATLMRTAADPTAVQACYLVLLSEPPKCGEGIPVEGVDIFSVGDARTHPNGLVETPRMRLVGTWNGHVLSLKQRPQPVSDSSPPPSVCSGPPQSGDRTATQQRLNDDAPMLGKQGIMILEDGFCSDNRLYAVVAVADPAAVTYLEQNYGPITVVGWLHPA